MLGELSGSFAHELNQPLSAILSNPQAAQRFLVREPPQLDQVAEILVDIVKADKRAGEVIARLRALLRNEAPQHRPIDVNGVVQEVLALMRSDLVNRQVRVRTELAPALSAVSGDRIQLQQVLLNLLINAADAMASFDAPRVLVVRSELASAQDVTVSVADRGPGSRSGRKPPPTSARRRALLMAPLPQAEREASNLTFCILPDASSTSAVLHLDAIALPW